MFLCVLNSALSYTLPLGIPLSDLIQWNLSFQIHFFRLAVKKTTNKLLIQDFCATHYINPGIFLESEQL